MRDIRARCQNTLDNYFIKNMTFIFYYFRQEIATKDAGKKKKDEKVNIFQKEKKMDNIGKEFSAISILRLQ